MAHVARLSLMLSMSPLEVLDLGDDWLEVLQAVATKPPRRR